MFTIIFVALFLGSGLVLVIVLTSLGFWQHRARAMELRHCADHPEVTLSPSWPAPRGHGLSSHHHITAPRRCHGLGAQP